MGKGSPSMIALLGLLAVAGYQNRDKLAGLLQGQDRGRQGDGAGSLAESMRQLFGAGTQGQTLGQAQGQTGGGILDGLRNMLGAAGGGAAGTGIAGGLTELLDRFRAPEQAAKAQSWVAPGTNATLSSDDLQSVLDEDTLAELTRKTGLGRGDLLDRLSAVLPDAVDRLTPQGRLPTPEEARQYG
ncbi:MAG: YidB family protein [Gemmobacter sp.]